MNNVLGTKFTPVVAADGSSTGKADVLGGHVDILSDNIGAGGSSVVEGDLRLEVVISSERSKLYPDVPTFEEVTGKAVDSFSARGFMAPKGMEPEVLATIEAAIEEACNDPELVDTLADIRFGHGNVGSEGKRNGRTGISASGRRQTKKNQGLCVV